MFGSQPAPAGMPEVVPLDAAGPKIALLGLLLIAAISTWVWWVYLGRKRMIQDIPTSAARGVALGLNELTGTVVCAHPEPSPQAAVDCVWWKNTYYERDDNSWKKTRDRVGGPAWFDLEDDSGTIAVRPRKAEVVAPKVYDGPIIDRVALDPDASLVTRYIASRVDGTKKRKVVEHAIGLGEQVYVLGTAQLPTEDLNVYIGPDRTGPAPFMVRVGSEADALFTERLGTVLGSLVALVSAAAAGVAWADGQALNAGTIMWTDVDPVAPLVFVSVASTVMAVASLLFVYNGLVRLRQRAQAAWGLIDVQLRRRHDLLPNLAEVVKAHAAHELTVQRSLVDLRSNLAADLPPRPSDRAVASADRAIRDETMALDRLLALVEAYPTLTADSSFASLREDLVDTENRVALARSFYNTSVQTLHDRARAVPGNLVAWLFELDLTAEFEPAAETDRAAVDQGPSTPPSRSEATRPAS